MHLRNILMVFYLIGKAHDLSNRCASSWHVPSRELGTCSKELDGLYCMHQLFPGRKPHKLYSVVFEGVFMKNKKICCSYRTVSTPLPISKNLTVSNSNANVVEHFFEWYLKRLKCYWWLFKSFRVFVRYLRSKIRNLTNEKPI